MNVSEIMANVVQTVTLEDSVFKAAKIMKEYDIGCVLVNDSDRLLGVITDRDLVTRALASPSPLQEFAIAEIMTAEPVCCAVDDTVKQAATIMEANQVRRLPVLDFGGELAGIVTIGDICTHAPHEIAGELIEQVSQPRHSFLAKTA